MNVDWYICIPTYSYKERMKIYIIASKKTVQYDLTIIYRLNIYSYALSSPLGTSAEHQFLIKTD